MAVVFLHSLLPLLPLVTIITCLFTSIPLLSAATATNTPELALEICKNTTDFSYCRAVVYSDHRAATADRVVLAYIAFGNAYQNATATSQFIESYLNSTKGDDEPNIIKGIRKCRNYYREAVRALYEAMNNLDSESYYDMDKVAVDVDGCARACEASVQRGRSKLSKMNRDMMKLANICYVVAKLFPYA